MLGKRIINTGGGGDACTTDTTQILNAGTTETLALYRFEDNADDTSGSTGYINKGAVFNGSNSKINLTAGSFTYTSAFSIAAWIKLSSSQSSQIILENYDYLSSTSRGFVFKVMTGEKLKFDGYYSDATRTDARSNESIPLGVWTHVAAVYNPTSSSIKLYINGSEVTYHTQTYNTMQYHSNCAVNIGALTYGGGAGGTAEQFFDGNIDELRVYDDALTATEIGYIANNTTASIPTGNLVALYSFEGNANDSTSYPINGTASNVVYDYNGTAIGSPSYVTGKFGKAASLSNSDTDYFTTNISPTILGNSFSLSAWVYFTQNSGSSDYYSIAGAYWNGSSGNQSWIFYVNNGTLSFFSNLSSGSITVTGGTVPLNQWNFVAFSVNDQKEISVYLNGVQTTSAVSLSLRSNSINLTLGNLGPYSAGRTMYGLLDQVRVFDKALNPGEVNSLYNETATTAALSTISNPSTIAYYKMADATDETGSYNATASNVDFNAVGKYGFAGKFNGTNSKIDLPTGDLGIGTNNFSISLWFNSADITQNDQSLWWFQHYQSPIRAGGIVSSSSSGMGGDYDLRFYCMVGGASYNANTNSDILSSNTWYHAVFVKSSTSGMTIYINGSSVATNTSATGDVNTNMSSGGGNTIGYYKTTSSSLYFNGRIDQFRTFNKAISAAEVTKLYNEVQCANTIATPESYFNTVLFTPTTSTSALPVTGVGFSPGLAWVKYRGTGSGGSTQNHYWFDTVRGLSSLIYSSSTSAAYTAAAYVQSFDSDGITYVNNLFNRTGANSVVGWFWKAGSSNVTNNDGTLTSTVSASPESGFSIVRYTGTANYSDTLGHGLTKAPQLIIQKALSGTSDWYVLFNIDGTGAWDWAKLNTTNVFQADNPQRFATSSTTINNWGWNGYDMINYCFHDVPGYQRIGSYVGNGSANGPFIYTGFEPAWVIIKNADTAYRWYMLDNKRDTTNPNNARLFANTNAAESTNSNILNFHTNGFSLITSDAEVNKSGDTMIFMAMAANPDTTAPTKANSFKTVLYNGTGASQTITGAGFKPDLAWIKSRSNGTSHEWHDSVRGEPSRISSDLTSAAATSLNGFVSLASDGFTVDGTGGGGEVNTSGRTYAAWLWKALDHDRNLAAINNDGENDTIVSVNEEAGFGIVKGSVATSGYTAGLGHGFEVKPEFIIYKPLLSGHHWWAFADYGGSLLGTNNLIKFSDVTVASSDSLFSITDKVFKTGATSTAHDFIAYCWRSVAGYSRIGTYTGASGSKRVYNTSDGTSTGSGGFTPSFIIIRNRGVAGAWMIYDSARSSDPLNKTLMVNYASAEQTQSSATINLHSDGFTINGNVGASNSNGNSYFYMAFK